MYIFSCRCSTWCAAATSLTTSSRNLASARRARRSAITTSSTGCAQARQTTCDRSWSSDHPTLSRWHQHLKYGFIVALPLRTCNMYLDSAPALPTRTTYRFVAIVTSSGVSCCHCCWCLVLGARQHAVLLQQADWSAAQQEPEERRGESVARFSFTHSFIYFIPLC